MKYKPITPLTKNNLLDRIDERKVFKYYLGLDKLDLRCKYINPLRRDTHPGCSFFNGSYGVYKDRLIFHDFALSRSYDCFDIVMEKFNLSFYKALEKINKDFKIGLNTSEPVQKIKKDSKSEKASFGTKGKKLIQVQKKEFSDSELEYWKSFGISSETLKKYNVISVDKVYVDKEFRMRSTKKNPIFAYILSPTSIKIYRPLDKKQKWMTNQDPTTYQGMSQTPFMGDLIFITSSLKDVMVLHELGYAAIAPNSEKVPDQYTVNMLKSQFKEVIVFYDSDGGFTKKEGKGKYIAGKTSSKYNMPFIYLDSKYKDISDYYKAYGKTKTKNKLIDMLEHHKYIGKHRKDKVEVTKQSST